MSTARLSLKVRLLIAEMIETLLYGCATWTLNATHHSELRKAHLQRVLDFQRRADHANLSHAKALKKTKGEIIEERTIRKWRLFFVEAMVRPKMGRLLCWMFAQIAVGKSRDQVVHGTTGWWWWLQNPEGRPRRFSIHRWSDGRFPTAVWRGNRTMSPCSEEGGQVVSGDPRSSRTVYGQVARRGGR